MDELLPTRNALVHLPSFVDGGSCTVPPTPRFFNAFALDYDFIPTASEPAEWLEFLRQIGEDDNESITPKRSVRPRTPLDPDPEPADQEPLTTANASAQPPF